jgi:hypothetical protein
MTTYPATEREYRARISVLLTSPVSGHIRAHGVNFPFILLYLDRSARVLADPVRGFLCHTIVYNFPGKKIIGQNLWLVFLRTFFLLGQVY